MIAQDVAVRNFSPAGAYTSSRVVSQRRTGGAASCAGAEALSDDLFAGFRTEPPLS